MAYPPELRPFARHFGLPGIKITLRIDSHSLSSPQREWLEKYMLESKERPITVKEFLTELDAWDDSAFCTEWAMEAPMMGARDGFDYGGSRRELTLTIQTFKD